jgi:peptidoglycan-associated lipoprotein
LLYAKIIYFDFDRDTIRSEFIDVLRAHAGYLIANPDARVTIEGHADERGSREYNIGLGERRANAVSRFLQAEGVNPYQLGSISYGEERPAVYGNDELSWAENRRAVLVY